MKKLLSFFLLFVNIFVLYGFIGTHNSKRNYIFETGRSQCLKLDTSLHSNLKSSQDITTESPFRDIEKCLIKEYATFFTPMDKKYYSSDVIFEDPLNVFQGIDKYQNNVDLLSGKTLLGSILFEDASISLHNIEILDEETIQTRWTLKMTIKILPWKPRPQFTGISIYTIDKDLKQIRKQQDFWDSINLRKGKYEKVSFQDGLGDFLSQLKKDSGAQMAAPELPYELLRRSKRYEVRRYPAQVVAETQYTQRPEGYDRLGSYCGGSNVEAKKINFFSPTLMKIKDVNKNARYKTMEWPLQYLLPGNSFEELDKLPESTISSITLKQLPSRIVAVTQFDLAATEPIVRGFTKQLVSDCKLDGLIPTDASEEENELIIGQYDALFSLNKRRNEVWVELKQHCWI